MIGDLVNPFFLSLINTMFAKVSDQPKLINRPTVRAIFFDFDGTIADTLDEFVNIVNRLAVEFGYPVATPETVERLRNLSSKEILKVSPVPIWQIPFLIRRLKKELGREIQFLTPICGIKTTLQQLKSRGIQVGILTSNSKENVARFLQENGMENLFDQIYAGSSILGKDKILRKILRQENLQPEELVYVGDETRDVDAARKSGVYAIAVGWGFNSPRALATHHPDFLVREPRELIEVIEYLKRREARLATPPLTRVASRNSPQNNGSLPPLVPRRRHQLPLPLDAQRGD